MTLHAVFAAFTLTVLASAASSETPNGASSARIVPGSMVRIGSVDLRFQSYNVEMIEVTGGRFWKPYGSVGEKPPGLPADVPFGMPPPGDLVPEYQRRLERVVTKTLGRNRPPVTARVEIGEAAQRIIDAAHRADSIVMATSGRSGFSRLLIGSVAERVVRHATVPVLTLRIPARKRRKGRT